MNHELNMHELDAVSGGLWRQPGKDRANQAAANRNDGSNTVGGSLTDAGNVFVSWGYRGTGPRLQRVAASASTLTTARPPQLAASSSSSPAITFAIRRFPKAPHSR